MTNRDTVRQYLDRRRLNQSFDDSPSLKILSDFIHEIDTISILKMIEEVNGWRIHKNIFQRLKEGFTNNGK